MDSKNIMRIVILSLCVLFLISCKSFRKKTLRDDETKVKCDLISAEFDIDKSSFKEFTNEINLCFNSQNQYEFLKIYMKGGDHSKSYLKRWYLDGKGEWFKIFKWEGLSTMKKVSKLKVGPLEMINRGSFILECPSYRTKNNTYLFYILKKGEVVFQYLSLESELETEFISVSDHVQINESLRLFSQLDEESLD